MWRAILVTTLMGATLWGCAAPGPKLGPPPQPVLSTRPPRQVPAIPPPEHPAPAPPVVPSDQGLRGTTVVVDAGHGGKDPGALGRGSVPEKVIVLDIAQQVAGLLGERGANVVMTRTSDRFIELDSRAAMAERARADLFVSIHADSAKRLSASGITIYVSRNATAASHQAAQHVAAALKRAGFELRGVQTAGYRVLVGHSRPALLVECGFVSNRTEAQRLSTPSYRTRIAEAIAEGISAHLGR